MILNRKHGPWLLFVLIATGFCALLYLSNFYPDRLPESYRIKLPAFFGEIPPKHNSIGGTPLGISFGLAALAIFIFAMLLNGRKKVRTWLFLGSVQFWLRAHIWLTILTIPLVLFHSGFRLGAQMTSLLMVLYAIVMASGFFGLALQQFMPRLMMAELPQEAVFEQIPFLRAQYVEKAKAMRASFDEKAKKAAQSARVRAVTGDATPSTQAVAFGDAADAESAVTATTSVQQAPAGEAESQFVECLDDDVIPFIKARHGSKHRLAAKQVSDDLFRLLKLNVPQEYHPSIEEMQAWCDERRLMDTQTRLQHWLHGWLLIHVPISFLLLILTIWHAVATLYFF